MDEPRIKIGFSLTDTMGNEYSASSDVEVFESLDESELDVIGDQLNAFLKQVGYIRERSCMLMEDLTEDEHEALLNYLQEMRDKEESSGE